MYRQSSGQVRLLAFTLVAFIVGFATFNYSRGRMFGYPYLTAPAKRTV